MTLAEVFAVETPSDDAEAEAAAFATWLALPPASRRDNGSGDQSYPGPHLRPSTHTGNISAW